MTLTEDPLFLVLVVLCVGLPSVELAWRRWRRAHPVRRSPSRREWARLRAANLRTVAARDEAEEQAIQRRAAVRRRLDVVAAQCRAGAVVAARRRSAATPDGWVRAFSGSLT
ncbi:MULTISPECIES: hypothetical protein [Actinoalloteichus]|uniref:Uncharacterized protein n=1 Tax=Actinoalloteichus fjordicus TaxID=1612552 RepID=A0AAC9LC07_9PSEU|nr:MULTISPECIES: hypothetical protein [Actinoalloteichus]APU14806.1 hypothetical protein UA74_13740 [Actinoalloteichus fjordicus]APU20777.1 hypothetical protein UA75_13835 [Actinoalloteichus sp. GBA129-24]